MRLLVLIVALGLVVPMVPAAGHACDTVPGDAIECGDADADAPAEPCCAGESDQDDNADAGRDCCPSDCDCSCCGCAWSGPVMYRPASAAVALMPPSAPQVDRSTGLSPQDSAEELIRPPQA
jgi:hypothetical protein